jgi:hypothetical protein
MFQPACLLLSPLDALGCLLKVVQVTVGILLQQRFSFLQVTTVIGTSISITTYLPLTLVRLNQHTVTVKWRGCRGTALQLDTEGRAG